MDGGDKGGRSSGQQTVLIVEDEDDLVTMLTYNLEREGYTVHAITDGDEAVGAAADHRPAIIILDWMLPNKSGLDICRQLRRGAKTRDIPVIMLTARGEENDRIRGLDAGADDYIAKPFSTVELMARIRAVLRRTGPSSSEDALEFADTRMDLVAHRVTRAGRDIHLGPTEFRLLRHFMQYPGRVFSREQLLDVVWGHDVYVELRTVDVHIRRLRKALNDGDLPDIIRTVRSAGYALDRPKPDGGPEA